VYPVAAPSVPDPAPAPACVSGVCAIVLAGGRSTRFGGDKRAALIDGRPLLSRAIDAVSVVADEVIVALAPGEGPPVPLPADVRVVHDPEAHGGPVVGLLAGASATVRDRVLVVGGDTPRLVPGVLRVLLDALVAGHEAAALGAGPDGAAQPLPLALRREPVLAMLGAAPAAGTGRSLRRLLRRLDTAVVPEERWRPWDPDAATLLDVDRPEDLGAGR
jgi:molybdopterin-guanine dinucleotide biosynthesis protein A